MTAIDAIDSKRLKEYVASNQSILESFLQRRLPGGKKKGSNWICGNVIGEAGDSLSIPLTGELSGIFKDFNTNESGDIFSLVATQDGLDLKSDFKKIVETVASEVGYTNFEVKPSTYKPTTTLAPNLANIVAQLKDKSYPAPVDSKYLVSKGIEPHDGLVEIASNDYNRITKRNAINPVLLVPMYDIHGILQSYQSIEFDGVKKHLPGASVKGLFCTIPLFPTQDDEVLYLAEGYATAKSIYEVSGIASVCCFGKGNIKEVAIALQYKFPNASIVLCADVDAVDYIKELAIELRSEYCVPIIDNPKGDFNDLATENKAEALKCLQDRINPAAAVVSQDQAQSQVLEPEPLRCEPTLKSEYPVMALGAVLGDAVLALEHLVKAPVDLCAQAVLASSSLAVQQHFDVLLPWGKTAPTSLMLLTVVDSGGRKSEVFDVVTRAAKDQEKMEMAGYRKSLDRYAIAAESWKKAVEFARASNKKKGMDAIQSAVDAVGQCPVAPVSPVRFVSDPTVEGLFKLMERSQPSVALFTDEAGALVGGHAMNADNFMKTISKLSKMWDGGTLDRVRAGDATSILYGRRLVVHLSAQPIVMKKLLNDPLANNQGFLARCLTAWSDVDWGNRIIDKFETPRENQHIQRLTYKLSELMVSPAKTSANDPQELDPVVLTLDREARKLALWLVNDLERKQAKDGVFSQIRDRASKSVEQMIRVAGVITGIEQGLSARVIDVATLDRASILVDWYLKEMLRIRTFAEVPEVITNAELLLNWLKDQKITRFGTRKVMRYGPVELRNTLALDNVITELLSSGYIGVLPPGTVVDGVKARKAWELCQ